MNHTIESIPRISPRARHYIDRVLEYGFHNTTSCGIYGELERKFAEKFGVGYAVAHANGTVTMHSALMAAGVGVGDEVIVPALTVFSTAAVALFCNAVPVFADVDPQTFTIDVEDLARKISPRTKAVIPVSIYGLAPDMDPIMALAEKHDLTVIEDNAQCFLGRYKGRLAGSIGQMASFSFQASKHMTCGDGGMLICDDEELATRARRAAVLGYACISAAPGASTVPEELRCHPSAARHCDMGNNYRLPEIAAAVALAELERLDELVAMRQACGRIFAEVVRDCAWLIPQKTPEDCVHACWTYVARIADDGPDWAEFRKKFVELGGDGFYGAWRPVYKEPVFAKLSKSVAESPDRWPQFAGIMPDYREVCCPQLERIQPRLVQLKTNYFDLAEVRRQADLLGQAIAWFS